MNYQLIRAKRKSICLQVKCGNVVVRAPAKVAKSVIDDFVLQKAAWLKNTIDRQLQLNALSFNFRDGNSLLYLGELLPVKVKESSRSSVIVVQAEEQRYILVSLNRRNLLKEPSEIDIAKRVKKQLEFFFKKEAEILIGERLSYLSEATKLVPTHIKIRQYKARWGSCNSRGEVSFNYLLLMAPQWVIDYVIIHELCHLAYLNHSSQFWQLVQQHCPHYKNAKRWFKDNQARLAWQLTS